MPPPDPPPLGGAGCCGRCCPPPRRLAAALPPPLLASSPSSAAAAAAGAAATSTGGAPPPLSPPPPPPAPSAAGTRKPRSPPRTTYPPAGGRQTQTSAFPPAVDDGGRSCRLQPPGARDRARPCRGSARRRLRRRRYPPAPGGLSSLHIHPHRDGRRPSGPPGAPAPCLAHLGARVPHPRQRKRRPLPSLRGPPRPSSQWARPPHLLMTLASQPSQPSLLHPLSAGRSYPRRLRPPGPVDPLRPRARTGPGWPAAPASPASSHRARRRAALGPRPVTLNTFDSSGGPHLLSRLLLRPAGAPPSPWEPLSSILPLATLRSLSTYSTTTFVCSLAHPLVSAPSHRRHSPYPPPVDSRCREPACSCHCRDDGCLLRRRRPSLPLALHSMHATRQPVRSELRLRGLPATVARPAAIYAVAPPSLSLARSTGTRLGRTSSRSRDSVGGPPRS